MRNRLGLVLIGGLVAISVGCSEPVDSVRGTEGAPLLEDQFRAFLADRGHDPAQEFFLPAAVQAGITAGRCRVRVLPPAGRWFGVTRPEDAARVRQQLAEFHTRGIYPEDLKA